jgi:hypothetical protein
MEGFAELNPERKPNICRSIWAAARSGKYVINVILACLAVALEIYYSICGGSCSYL